MRYKSRSQQNEDKNILLTASNNDLAMQIFNQLQSTKIPPNQKISKLTSKTSQARRDVIARNKNQIKIINANNRQLRIRHIQIKSNTHTQTNRIKTRIINHLKRNMLIALIRQLKRATDLLLQLNY